MARRALRIAEATAALLLAVVRVFAQNSQDDLASKVLAVKYSALAAAARIQGDVRLNVTSEQANLIDGPPLLRDATLQIARALISTGNRDVTQVTVHFALVSTVTRPHTEIVKKGDAFDRVILRLLGMKTEKTITEDSCEPAATPPNEIKVAGAAAEVWIYGAVQCLAIQAGYLLAQR
jgi:hypothetical protein